MGGRDPADLDVVDAQARHRRVVSPDVHDLHPLATHSGELVVGERQVDADQSVDAARDRSCVLEHVSPLTARPHGDDDRVVPGLGEHCLGPGQHMGEVPAVEQRDGDGDRTRPACCEARRGRIGAVAQLGRDLLDPLACGHGHVGEAAQRTADGGDRHPGCGRDVFDGRSLAARDRGVRWHRSYDRSLGCKRLPYCVRTLRPGSHPTTRVRSTVAT